MMNVNQLFKTGVNALTNNSPAILTAFGAVGVVGTAVLSGRATYEAANEIRDEDVAREEGGADYLTTSEKVKLVWPLYIPAATSGVLSVGAIVLSHRISSRRAAVLAAVYALNESKVEEYQDKIQEKFGDKKEKEARDEIAQDRVNRDYDETEMIFSPLDGKVVIRDDYSGRFFWSSVEEVNRAVNQVNHEALMENSVRLSEFYDVLNLDHISTSDYVGWNSRERCEIDWSTCTTPDGKHAAHSFEFINPPILNPGDGAGFR